MENSGLPWLAPSEIELPAHRADLPRRTEALKLLKPLRILVTLAMLKEFQALLESGEVRNRAGLARRFSLTRARVTQIMHMLALAPEVVRFIEDTRCNVSERSLKPMLAATPAEQLQFVRTLAVEPTR